MKAKRSYKNGKPLYVKCTPKVRPTNSNLWSALHLGVFIMCDHLTPVQSSENKMYLNRPNAAALLHPDKKNRNKIRIKWKCCIFLLSLPKRWRFNPK